MEYFENFVSNTTAGSGNQSWFAPEDANKVQKAIVFFKLTVRGKLNYSLLYSNIVDSTFADGTHSHCNMVCEEWRIHSLRLATCDAIDITACKNWNPCTFNGELEKSVHPGEMFATDPLLIDGKTYLAIEITFSGSMLPHHPESIVSGFVAGENGWEESTYFPYPSMIGVEREVKTRIGFWGDSITQGIGTEKDSYTHWNAVCAGILGDDYSYWNLGIGYARARDAASCGAWAYKAGKVDVLVLTFGVNDLYHDKDKEALKKNIETIVTEAKNRGQKVVLQTIPPFDYEGEVDENWRDVNCYVREVLAPRCDLFFDNVPILGKEVPHENESRFGGHPNAEGCKLWGEALAKAIQEII